MTEYYKEDFYNEYAIKKGDTTIAIVDSGSNARKIVECLNNLHEENQQLETLYDVVASEKRALEKENLALKQALKEYEEITSELFEENKKLRRINNDLLDKIE